MGNTIERGRLTRTYSFQGVDDAVLLEAAYTQRVAERAVAVRALALQHGQLDLQLLHPGGRLLGELQGPAHRLLQHEHAVDELRVR